jgi:UDP-N-acetylmuramoyl-L-alanine---L-glutamate ligase
MRAADLRDARVAIWGLGREGRAAIRFLRARHPGLHLIVLDDAEGAARSGQFDKLAYAFGPQAIDEALGRVDVLVKSPGVSLYRPEIARAREQGVVITSLLNLWFGEGLTLETVCVTGTKGKSTTASLLAHILARLGRRTALAGNIGVPVAEIDQTAADIAVIEVSSYQAADFDGLCDIAGLTSLFPEHLDWHGSLDAYYRDKLNLLRRSRYAIANRAAAPAHRLAQEFFGDEGGLHSCGNAVFDSAARIGVVGNRYLARPHNLSNLCAALAVVKRLGLDLAAAVAAAEDFRALPHRQQEIGEIDGVLYVDDSISTAPQSTLAALDVYAGREVTLIVGGHDRGIDYRPLVERLAGGAAHAVVCLGDSGRRIHDQVRARNPELAGLAAALSMTEAVATAKRMTGRGGVVLLSPAAPSYGQYRDFAERGRDFAVKAGFAGVVTGEAA